jgi:uncharacterized protein (TIGR03067 family)
VRRILLILILIGSLLAGSCGDDTDGPSLTGAWNGHELGGGEEEWTFVFDAAVASATSAGSEVYEGTYVAYPDESPMRLDMLITESRYRPFVGETALAIYRFEGDTLILASNEPGVPEAPTGFTPAGGTRVWELESE